jgi:predicted transcriptional regulator
MASLAAVLSEDNRALLRVIRDAKPRSLTKLAELTGHKVPNLSRTLRTMASYGLVELKRNNRDVQPMALATEFLVVLD